MRSPRRILAVASAVFRLHRPPRRFLRRGEAPRRTPARCRAPLSRTCADIGPSRQRIIRESAPEPAPPLHARRAETVPPLRQTPNASAAPGGCVRRTRCPRSKPHLLCPGLPPALSVGLPIMMPHVIFSSRCSVASSTRACMRPGFDKSTRRPLAGRTESAALPFRRLCFPRTNLHEKTVLRPADYARPPCPTPKLRCRQGSLSCPVDASCVRPG